MGPLTNADGSVFLATFIGDPRFSSQTRLLASARLQVPGGLTWEESASYAIAANSLTTLAIGGWTNLYTVNGHTYTNLFTGSNLTSVVFTPEGRRITVQLDTQGRLSSESQPGLATTTVSYDTGGHLTSVSDQSAEGTRTLMHGYDSLGRLSLITDALGRTNAFAYDAANRLRQFTLADGRVATFQCDSEDNVSSITPPGHPAYTFSYGAVGQLTGFTPPLVSEDDSIHFAYDTRRNLAQVQLPDGQVVHLNWNPDNNPSSIALGSGPTLSYGYSTRSGQLTGITSSTGDDMGFTYQGSLLASVQWSGSVNGSVSVQYNADLLPAVQTVDGVFAVAYSYDGDRFLTNAGPLALTRDNNGFVVATSIGLVQDQRHHDDLGRMTNYSVTVGGANFWSVALAFDPLDRITNKVESLNGAVSRTWQFVYDIDSRLSRVWLNGALAATYTYDANGNRLTRNSETAGYDAQDRVQTYAGAGFTWSPNGTLLTATTGGQTTRYTYDLRGALARVALPSGLTLDYVLDGFGRRIGKEVNGVLQKGWLYDTNDRPVAELASVATNCFVFADQSSTPSFMMNGTNAYALISDERGSVRFVINTLDGTVAQALDYDEFGRVASDSNPGFQPFGFAGGLYDPDTGLVRFGARDYDSRTGRWTSRDPIGFACGGFNLYAYASYDPVNVTDPSGTGPGHPPSENQNPEPHGFWHWVKTWIFGEPVVNPNADQLKSLYSDPTYSTLPAYQEQYHNGEKGIVEIGVSSIVAPLSLEVPGGKLVEEGFKKGVVEPAASHVVEKTYHVGGE